jgi:hypothetical protein
MLLLKVSDWILPTGFGLAHLAGGARADRNLAWGAFASQRDFSECQNRGPQTGPRPY